MALGQVEAEKRADQADSVRREQEVTLAAQRKEVERHRQDSVQQVERRKEQAAEAARKANDKANDQVYSLMTNARIGQEFMRNEAAVGQRARLPRKLYVELYDKLLADFATTPAADGITRLAKAQRLKKLLDLAVEVEGGHQVALEKAIRKETNLDKVLALTGL